ncbi:GNAT family N-acetyltransferase [Rhizobium sp. P38BS-XIX]|uniref:GNAT family N-acetyltransferase n=1 Tax=Rhizobium sp. P38BS-XIX TaxID=2726740 RepID=UPI0014570D1E|nr:GNAT family N-acetyltransferase [Rhizobium sp. P38BS-XIX]NLR98647.1 GNAT family N-acetyltransferase [Rhizobium sp. P38BS-XIX]
MEPTFSPPRLETERLILTGHTIDDFEPLAGMWSDPLVVKHIFGTVVSTSRESWMRMLSYHGLWPLLGHGYWAVREKSSGRYVGDLGFADFHRVIEPPIKGIPEAGWAFAAWAHGQGFATEALAAAAAWLDKDARFDRSVCLISPENTASIRVAQKAGYGNPQPIRLNNKDTLLFSRMRQAPKE